MNDKRQRRSFNDEFKHQIVQLYNAGKPKSEICREYDLVPTVVDRPLYKGDYVRIFNSNFVQYIIYVLLILFIL
jgi:hypothetical protein